MVKWGDLIIKVAATTGGAFAGYWAGEILTKNPQVNTVLAVTGGVLVYELVKG
jgi:zinc transporter ZupT